MTDRNRSYTSPRQDVAALIPQEARRILELGCSTGATAALIKERQPAEVVGIERDISYTGAASVVLDQLLIMDLNEPGWADNVTGVFDCIVAADVLEHLKDPWAVLTQAVERMTADGCVVLSLPNVRHIATIAGLVAGRWPYRDRGTHDATHLRFFGIREIDGLCAAAGLEVETVVRNHRFLDRSSRLDVIASAAARTRLREFFAYQYLVRGRRGRAGRRPAPESVPPWVAPVS